MAVLASVPPGWDASGHARAVADLDDGALVAAFEVAHRAGAWLSWVENRIAAEALSRAQGRDDAVVARAADGERGLSVLHGLERSSTAAELAACAGMTPNGVYARAVRGAMLGDHLPAVDALAATGAVDHVKTTICLDLSADLVGAATLPQEPLDGPVRTGPGSRTSIAVLRRRSTRIARRRAWRVRPTARPPCWRWHVWTP